MAISDELRQLYESKLEFNQSGDGFYSLQRRRGSVNTDNLFSALPVEEQAPLQEAWYIFHEAAHHKTYEDFFSKIEYCRRLTDKSIDIQTFLQLIADRSFLFLEFCENGNDPSYPLLSKLVENCEANSRGYSKEAVAQVLKKALIPTSAHKRYYRILDENLHELLDAKRMRERQLQIPLQIDDFSISISPQEPLPLSERDEVLSKLFYAYARACEQTAYVRFSSVISNASRPWSTAVHTISCYLDEHPCDIPGYSALVFFALFTQNAEKLLSGKLKKFNFKKLPPRESVKADPNETHKRISRRIDCNIELFDQLLEIFAPENATEEYIADAKYAFLLFSRYNRYWHFDLSDFCRGDGASSHYDLRFGRQRDYKDGVDHLGNLIRYHIKYCIPNQADQLLPVLISPGGGDWRPLATLTSFLLYESCQHVPTQQQLTHRIEAFLGSEAGKDTFEKYVHNRHDDYELEELLNKCCTENDFFIKNGSSVLYEPGTNAKAIQHAPRLILEYALRFRMIQEAERNLERVADVLFQSLLP